MIAIYPLHPLLTSMSTTPWTSALILTITTYLAYELYTFLRLRHIPGPAFASSITKQWMIRKALKGRFHLDLKALSDQYGPLVRIGPDELLSTDPQILRRMSAARSSYTKGKSYESAQLKQGVDNLVAMRDEKAHKELRERTKPAFTNRPEALEEGINEQLCTLMRLIETKYLSHPLASKDKKRPTAVPVDLARIFHYLALDVISQLSFSGALGFLSKDEDLYQCIEINEAGLHFQSWIATYHWIPRVLSRWPFSLFVPKEGDDLGFGRMMRMVTEVVKARLGAEDQALRNNDMLQACVDAGMSEAELAEMCFLFIVAGADSSAYAMNMTLASLLTNPRAYLALRSEIDAAIASSRIQDSGKPVTDAEARSLPYLQGVLREGLRMFPPLIGLVSKQVPPDGDVINGYFVPGGTQIGHNIYGVGRLKSFWGEDADIFRPERWLEAGFGTEREKEMLAVLDLNFGSGKYQCLGKNIANMELNKVFVELLRRFDFGLVNPTDPIHIKSSTFMMAKNFWVVISKREEPR